MLARWSTTGRSPGSTGSVKMSDAGWLRGQTTRRRIHRRSDGGPERRHGAPAGDQSTENHVTPNLPVVRQDRILSQSRQTTRLVASQVHLYDLFSATRIRRYAGARR